MIIVEFHVKDSKSAEKFVEKINQFEAESVYLWSRDNFLSWYLVRARFSESGVKRWYWYLRHRLWRLYSPVVYRYHTFFTTYNAKEQINAYIYKPWALTLRDVAGYIVIRDGSLEKTYRKLEADIDHKIKHISVRVSNGGIKIEEKV